MNSVSVVEKEIRELMATESRQIEAGIDVVVERIQNTISVQYLPLELLGIMNVWARTEWYHFGVAKFEYCLHTIVAQEVTGRVFDHLLLKLLLKGVRYGGEQMVDEDDLRWAVNRVSNALSSSAVVRRYWQTMDIDLLVEAKHWVSVHGEHVTMGDEGHFQWYDSIKEVVCYHLPHIPEPEEHIEEQVAMRSLEILPSDFQHEADWTCAICLDVDAPVPRCVITECVHIYHELCLKNHYYAFLKQKKNENKTCFSCPLCRAIIN